MSYFWQRQLWLKWSNLINFSENKWKQIFWKNVLFWLFQVRYFNFSVSKLCFVSFFFFLHIFVLFFKGKLPFLLWLADWNQLFRRQQATWLLLDWESSKTSCLFDQGDGIPLVIHSLAQRLRPSERWDIPTLLLSFSSSPLVWTHFLRAFSPEISLSNRDISVQQLLAWVLQSCSVWACGNVFAAEGWGS